MTKIDDVEEREYFRGVPAELMSDEETVEDAEGGKLVHYYTMSHVRSDTLNNLIEQSDRRLAAGPAYMKFKRINKGESRRTPSHRVDKKYIEH